MKRQPFAPRTEWAQLTVRIPVDLIQRLKVKAVLEKTSVGLLVRDALEELVGKEGKE